MQLVFIDEKYTDYLRVVDTRVPYNKNVGYKRPFVGVVFEIGEHKYFAPLTSSGKGVKLQTAPMQESITFLPINNCRHGGINFNNMIPVVDGVCALADTVTTTHDTDAEKKYKVLLQIQLSFINSNKKKIETKAQALYRLQTNGHLWDNYKTITCDFKKLEKRAKTYLQA